MVVKSVLNRVNRENGLVIFGCKSVESKVREIESSELEFVGVHIYKLVNAIQEEQEVRSVVL